MSTNINVKELLKDINEAFLFLDETNKELKDKYKNLDSKK